jgi:hypothetical protein
MNTSKLLVVALAALTLGIAVPDLAAAHRGGSWLRPAEVQLRVENRGYGLAVCRGRGALHADAPVVDPQFASFRHFECFVNIRGSGVLCVHTKPGKRIVLAPRPRDQRRCRF